MILCDGQEKTRAQGAESAGLLLDRNDWSRFDTERTPDTPKSSTFAHYNLSR